jgi:hypothetical protein
MDDTLPDISNPALGPGDMLTDLVAIFTGAINGHERSQQKAIGPSEIGHPCDRKLAYKLTGHAKVNTGRLPWKPTIGTAVHSWAQEAVERWNWAQPGFETDGPRFLLESRVDIGEAGGEEISGSCDIYDRLTATVGDYKIVGAFPLRKYIKEGPGPQYRIQAHAYARGWHRRGYPVRHVAIWFLPREHEFDKHHRWTAPYDEQVVLDALTRLDGVAKLAAALGPVAATLLGTAEAHCRYCPYLLPGSQDLVKGCPGDPGATAPGTSLQSLIA